MHADELVWAVENLANSDRKVRTTATDKCLRFQTANGFDTGVCVKLMRADMGINIRVFAYESLAVVIEKLWRSLRPQVQSEIIQLYPFHDAGDRDNLSLRPFLARVLGIFFAYVAEPSAIENFFGYKGGTSLILHVCLIDMLSDHIAKVLYRLHTFWKRSPSNNQDSRTNIINHCQMFFR